MSMRLSPQLRAAQSIVVGSMLSLLSLRPKSGLRSPLPRNLSPNAMLIARAQGPKARALMPLSAMQACRQHLQPHPHT